MGLAYIDFEQEEFGVAAALSGDPIMKAAYRSGDPYIAFGEKAGIIVPSMSDLEILQCRENLKQVSLGVLFGMGAETMAERTGLPVGEAKGLHDAHKETFKEFWAWSDASIDFANIFGYIETVFGWRLHVGMNTNPSTIRNFPMQANSAEILRLTCCLVSEAEIQVCAPIHDALLIEAPLEELNDRVAKTQGLMAEASSVVLGGFQLRTEAKIFRYPERFVDSRGVKMWQTVWEIIREVAPNDELCCVPELGSISGEEREEGVHD